MAAFDVTAFLSGYPELTLTDAGRVRCSLTGHEMPAAEKTLADYTSGAKFLRLRHLNEVVRQHADALEDAGEHFVCKLTGRRIAKNACALERHFVGRRYRRLEASAAAAPQSDGRKSDDNGSSLCSEDEGIEEDSGESIDAVVDDDRPYEGLRRSDAPRTDDYDWSLMMDTDCDGGGGGGDGERPRWPAKRRADEPAKADESAGDGGKKKRRS